VVSLWLEVGSRDASPTSLATAAGWLLAERAQAQVRVEPEGTELRKTCRVAGQGLARCVRELGAALDVSRVSAQDASRLRLRLREARNRAAGNAEREADVAALYALLGEHAAGLVPLGRTEDEPLITAEALQTFLQRHARPERALLIATGDVSDAALARAFAPFRRRSIPAPAIERPPLEPRPELRVEHAESAMLAFTLMAENAERAASVGHRFREIYPYAAVRVSRLRSHSLLHVRIPAGSKPLKRLQRAVFDLRRLELETVGSVSPPRDDGLYTLVRELGEQWSVRGGKHAPVTSPWPMGIAVRLRSADSLDPDSEQGRARLVATREAASQAIARGEQIALGATEGELDASHADVTAPNGAHIVVERRGGDRWMTAVVRFAGGSAGDPADRPGRAALLATLIADGCGFATGNELDARLMTLDARIAPLVDATGLGARIVAPAKNWRPALDALLRCAIRPALTQRAIEDARARLLRTLAVEPSAILRAFAARAAAPTTPGWVSSWGTPWGVSNVTAVGLRRLHRELLAGARLSVSLALDQRPDIVASFVARRVSALEPSAPSEPPAPGPAAEGLVGERAPVSALRAIVVFRAPRASQVPHGIAAQVLAHELGQVLTQRAGQVVWADGDANVALAHAAVALSLSELALPGLESRVAKALAELSRRADSFWVSRLDAADLSARARTSSAHGWAEAAFRGRRAGADLDAELAELKTLLAATPRFVVLRPVP
jgi:predicted Zn-dependent peptidase